MKTQRQISRNERTLRSRQRLVGLVAVAALAVTLVPQRAVATSVEKLDARELVAKSPTIVHGTVVSTTGRWNADRSLIVTETRLRVHATLKGVAGGEIAVLQPGGTVGKLNVEVPGAVPFRVGEEAVLFLVESANGDRFVQGLSQGRFEVVEDRFSGQKVVRGALLRELMQVESKPGETRGEIGALDSVGLERFLARVQDRVQGVLDTEVGR